MNALAIAAVVIGCVCALAWWDVYRRETVAVLAKASTERESAQLTYASKASELEARAMRDKAEADERVARDQAKDERYARQEVTAHEERMAAARRQHELELAELHSDAAMEALTERLDEHVLKHDAAIKAIAAEFMDAVGKREAHEPNVMLRLKKLETSVTVPVQRGVPGWQSKG